MQDLRLFGGSVKISLPLNFIDVGTFRQVPDHQEVFVEKHGDASIIVEILNPPSPKSDYDENVRYYLRQLLLETEERADLPINDLPDPTKKPIGPFDQPQDCYLSWLDYSIADDLDLKMALFRIPSVDADVLITLNRSSDAQLFTGIINSFNLYDWNLFS